MGDKSGIQWTNATWNPLTGCTKVSPGCSSCYAERVEHRYKRDMRPWAVAAAKGGRGVTLHEDRLSQPMKWTRPRMIFVNSMSDLFHWEVPDWFIVETFGVMAVTPRHTYQVLTKRPDRMADMLENKDFWHDVVDKAAGLTDGRWGQLVTNDWEVKKGYYLANLAVGTSVENQYWANARLPELARIRAAWRFVSIEPLLGPVAIKPWLARRLPPSESVPDPAMPAQEAWLNPVLDWVIVGGESGGTERRRLVERADALSSAKWVPKPRALEWVRDIRDECVEYRVPFFFKQWGGPTPTSGGRELDGREWSEMPEGMQRV